MNLLERISQEMRLNFTGCLYKNPKQNRVARAVKTTYEVKNSFKGRTANSVYVIGLYCSAACW